MSFFIELSKGILFIIMNMTIGYVFCNIIHKLLFYPKKVYLFGKYPLNFTPGIVLRKKKQLINLLHEKLKEYLLYADNDENDKNFLTDFELKIFKELIPIIKRYVKINWVPAFVWNYIEGFLEELCLFFIRRLTRTVIPKMAVEMKLHKKIDILDLKLDVYHIEKLFNEYIYQYMMKFMILCTGIVGLFNAILFWVIT